MSRSVQVVIACVALYGCGDDRHEQSPTDGHDAGGDAKIDANQFQDDAGPLCGLNGLYTFYFEGGPFANGEWRYGISLSTFRKTKQSRAMSDAGSLSCAIELGCDVPDIVDGQDLAVVFFGPAVLTGYSTDENKVFGLDPRSQGGDLLVVEVPGSTGYPSRKLRVGIPCGEEPDCTPIPEDIEALKTTLVTLVGENRPQFNSGDGSTSNDGCE